MSFIREKTSVTVERINGRWTHTCGLHKMAGHCDSTLLKLFRMKEDWTRATAHAQQPLSILVGYVGNFHQPKCTFSRQELGQQVCRHLSGFTVIDDDHFPIDGVPHEQVTLWIMFFRLNFPPWVKVLPATFDFQILQKSFHANS